MVTACSGSDDDDSFNDPNNPASNDANNTVLVNPNANNGGVIGNTNFQGGQRPLTDEERAVIEDATCAGWAAEPEPLPSRLMMVIDVSSSMSASTAATGNQSKWEVTRAALLDMVDSLPASNSIGMVLYPNKQVSVNNSPGSASDCVAVDALLPMDVLGNDGSPHRTDVVQTLQQAELNRSTPTHDAYNTALDAVLISPNPSVKTFLMLITDGEPTLSEGCTGEENLSPQPTQPIVDAVAEAAGLGYPTFIIGSPGSETTITGADARPWLSRAAEIGGTSQGNCSHSGEPYCHFDMTTADDFSAALREALAAIAGAVVQCTYPFPSPPAGETIDPNNINVVFTTGAGEELLVLRDGDGACTEGFYVTGDNSVVLCENTCNQVLSDGGATLSVHFGCGSIDTTPIE